MGDTARTQTSLVGSTRAAPRLSSAPSPSASEPFSNTGRCFVRATRSNSPSTASSDLGESDGADNGSVMDNPRSAASDARVSEPELRSCRCSKVLHLNASGSDLEQQKSKSLSMQQSAARCTQAAVLHQECQSALVVRHCRIDLRSRNRQSSWAALTHYESVSAHSRGSLHVEPCGVLLSTCDAGLQCRRRAGNAS